MAPPPALAAHRSLCRDTPPFAGSLPPASLLCLLEEKGSAARGGVHLREGGRGGRGKGVLLSPALPCRGAPEASALRPLRSLTSLLLGLEADGDVLLPARHGSFRAAAAASAAALTTAAGSTLQSKAAAAAVQPPAPIPPLALPGNCGGGGGGSSGQEKQRGGDEAAGCNAASVEGRCCWGKGRKGKGATPHAGGGRRRRRRLSPVQLGTYARSGVNETVGRLRLLRLAAASRWECWSCRLHNGRRAGGKEGKRNEPVELLSLETPPLDAREERETGTPEKKEPRIQEEVKHCRAPAPGGSEVGHALGGRCAQNVPGGLDSPSSPMNIN